MPVAKPVAEKSEKARRFFDRLWQAGDYWQLDKDPFERDKYYRQLAHLKDRRYGKILEIGCGSGLFTRALAPLGERVIAIDVSPSAIDRAKKLGTANGVIDFQCASALDFEPKSHGPFDLVVMSETIYYLGWIYTFFEVSWLAAELFDATSPGGRFLMCNSVGKGESYLHRRFVLETYRDVFRNVGYRMVAEDSFSGTKDGIPQDSLIHLFEKPADAPAAAV